MVKVSDVNDVPPKFSKQEWTVEVNEELPKDTILASLQVIDPDVKNDFSYRVSFFYNLVRLVLAEHQVTT